MTNWKDIHPDFTPELQREWTNNGFDNEEIKELIILGLEPIEANFAQWLKNWRWEKKEDKPKDILNRYNKEKLRKEYKEYLAKKPNSVYHPSDYVRNTDWQEKAKMHSSLSVLWSSFHNLCNKCGKSEVHTIWCNTCISHYNEKFQANFKSSTGSSGNQIIDEFIQKFQSQTINLEPNSHWRILRWIPYENFTDIKYVAKGRFGEFYKAKWGKDIDDYDKPVALKILKKSQISVDVFCKK
jgi:hypothetical protein